MCKCILIYILRVPIILIILMLSFAKYSQNYSSIIGAGLDVASRYRHSKHNFYFMAMSTVFVLHVKAIVSATHTLHWGWMGWEQKTMRVITIAEYLVSSQVCLQSLLYV